MAAFRDWQDRTELEGSFGSRAAGYTGVRLGIEPRPQRCCIRLFRSDDFVGRTAYRLGRAWNSGFFTGHTDGCDPTTTLGRCGSRACLWNAILLRPIAVPSS